MNRRNQWLALFFILGAILLGIALLFNLRLSGGNPYPVYSTLRSDPLGTRALFDSLAALPSLQVERSLKPLNQSAILPPRTLILAGMDDADWTHMPFKTFSQLNAMVRDGSRLVVTFPAKFKRQGGTDETTDNSSEPAAEPKPSPKPAKAQTKPDAKANDPGHQPTLASPNSKEASAETDDPATNWSSLWHIDLRRRWLMTTDGLLAHRRADAPRGLPATLAWASDLYFHPEKGSPWKVIYDRAGEPVLVEMMLGRGSVVLATDSFFLSNEALQRDRATSVLAWIVGDHTHIVFDESHLGVEEDPGIATLARHYGLQWAFFTALLLAVLFIWQRTALFVPPPLSAAELVPGHKPMAGIEALLRRSVPAGTLIDACLAEWRRSARPEDVARVTADLPTTARPVDAYNHAVRGLKKKFTL